MTSTDYDYGRYIPVPYATELTELADTYARARAFDVSQFSEWIRANRTRSLMAIGAGGSLAVAEVATALHARATGRLAQTAQPMDVYLASGTLADTAVIQVTAGGSHGDAVAMAEILPKLTPEVAVFCGTSNSMIERELGDRLNIFTYPLLPNVHSWVATNVLLGQVVVLANAYHSAFPDRIDPLPDTIDRFLDHGDSAQANVDYWSRRLQPILQKPSTICLFGPQTKAFATDLDSKFAESGLGEISLSEYRNFAHGRYQSLFNRQGQFGILGVATPDEHPIAVSIDQSFPSWIPHDLVSVNFGGIAQNQVGQLVTLLLIVGAIGEVRNLEIGWGSRNTFGDPLYEGLPTIYSIHQ